MRALGIDFGERRIGLALSDPTGTLASPLETVTRRVGKRPPLAKLEELARANEVVQLVVGLPLGRNGAETPWCEEVRRMGDALAVRLSVPVDYVDERMTSLRAERAVRSIGLPKAQREKKGRIDAAAAALILQAWLDGRPR
ncbi:MAG TPA: Holliday junction resolvase RuvX [Longimicrobiales bacterium]|nr:Holliday junction resolvase RuvX [Longimicrobiales bacterium]